MTTPNLVVALFITLVLAACSGGTQAQKESPTQQPTADDPPTAEQTAEPALADCTGGAVPEGASNCLLDLGAGKDTYWADTDGVEPGTAGCHIEYISDTCAEVQTGREFGEFCLDEDRLVESNPGTGECHVHKSDRGKPAVVSCSDWCNSTAGSTGRCEGGVAVDDAAASCESARCVCDEASG